MEKGKGYKRYFTPNPLGKNRYGESHIIGEKTKKMFSLSIDLVERLKEYAQFEKITQSDVVKLALKKYIKAGRAKDLRLFSLHAPGFKARANSRSGYFWFTLVKKRKF